MGRAPGGALFVACAVAALALGAPAVVDAGEPPQPSTRVIVFGDSVAHSFGCALGDDPTGSDSWTCDPVAGYEADNAYIGACSITRGNVLGYDGNLYKSPCNPKKDWAAQIDAFAADVVMLISTGYEITDRWVKRPTGTTHQWEPGPTHKWGKEKYTAGALRYAQKLREAIDVVLASGATMIVSNMPYVNSKVPAAGVFYEPYGPNPPADWVKPNKGAPYRPSRNKVIELNAVIASVVAEYQALEQPVDMFDFAGYFNPGDTFNRYVCLPEAPALPLNPALPCGRHETGAVLARHRDRLHLSNEGVNLISKPTLLAFLDQVLIEPEPPPDSEPETAPEPERAPAPGSGPTRSGPGYLPDLGPPDSPR